MIKRLSKSIRQYKKESILAPACVSFEVFLEVLIPYYMGRLIDNGINKGNMGYINKIGFILMGLCVISLTFGWLSGKFAAYASAGFAANLRYVL